MRLRLFINQLSNQLFVNKLSKLEEQPSYSEPGQEWVSKELHSSPAQSCGIQQTISSSLNPP